MNSKPNVLFIQADQWPWFCLSSLGDPNVRTPHLDKLAREGGVLFSNNNVQSPICLPSRLSMLTGCYVGTTRQPGFAGYVKRGLPWMPRFFKENGYATGAFGKFHAFSIGLDDWSFDVSAPTLGQDEEMAQPCGHHYRTYCEQHGVPWPGDQKHDHDPYHSNPKYASDLMARVSSHADKTLTPMEQFSALSDIPVEHSLETWTTERCIDFLKERAGKKEPFFAWASYDRPHYPTTLPPEWYQRVRPEDIDLHAAPSREVLAEMPMVQFNCFASELGISIFQLGDERFRKVLAAYYSLIEWIDDEIGRLIATLETLKLRDSTIIVFTSDHGDQAGKSGLVDKSMFLTSEAITRVPLIISMPQSVALKHRVIDAPVENIDLFPTLAALCGLGHPAGVEGRSLAPVVNGSLPPDKQRAVFCEDHWQMMIKKGKWRLTFDIESDGACLLHNLEEDPDQWVNHYHDDTLRSLRIALKKELLAFLCERKDGPYTEFDVLRARKGLDNDGTFLPLHTASCSKGLLLYHHRSAITITEAQEFCKSDYKIFVPFYPGEDILTWRNSPEQHRNQYPTRDKAVPSDESIVEPLMDKGLRKLMAQTPWISVWIDPKPERGERPSQGALNHLISKNRALLAVIALLGTSIFTAPAQAEVKMPAIFGDHMVLQQGLKLPVWGSAAPGEKITVAIADRRAQAIADQQGKWMVKLDPMPASGKPVELMVSASNKLVFKDVLIGDAWVCSGQSNMEFGIGRAHNALQAIAQANNPQIRLFMAQHHVAFTPQDDCKGEWVVCTPENIKKGGWDGFSAVAYFFGQKVFDARKQPLGLIQTCWGGTPAQSWTSLEALKSNPQLKDIATVFETNQSHIAELKQKYVSETLPKYEQNLETWKKEQGNAYFASDAYKNWQQQVTLARQTNKPIPPQPLPAVPWPRKPEPPDENSHLPVVLFNGMIQPIIPYGIKGALWYQGEADGMSEPTARKYATAFPALILDWRQRWNQGDFPFLFVQLAGYAQPAGAINMGKHFPLLRAAQLKTLSLPNTGMAVTIDIGEEKDIHPQDKLDVGSRLALAARHIAYGENIVYSGPVYKSVKVEGNKAVVFFDHSGSGLTIGSAPPIRLNQPQAAPADHLQAFEIAGADQKFVPAQANIQGDTVIVSSDQVAAPVAVRYAWSGYPNPPANLYNKEGLPASPFTTATDR